MADINNKIITHPVTIPPVHCCDEGGGTWGPAQCESGTNTITGFENNCNMGATIPRNGVNTLHEETGIKGISICTMV